MGMKKGDFLIGGMIFHGIIEKDYIYIQILWIPSLRKQYTLPKTNSSFPLKMDGWKISY